MTVCHEWQIIIKSTVLFDTLQIKSNESLENVITRVVEELSYGTQVRRLLLEARPGNDFDASLLPQLFPNVEDYQLSASINVKPNTFQPWHTNCDEFLDHMTLKLKQ
jgi:hypothetical protein